jgi:ribonuclease P protein component
MPLRYRFNRSQRISHKRDFDATFANKQSAGDARLVVYIRSNGLDVSRLGLSVGRRVGGAVLRNRVKRLLREAFRLAQHEIPVGWDIVCVARPTPAPTLDDYRASLVRLVSRAIAKRRGRA